MYNCSPQNDFIPMKIPIPRYQCTPLAKSYIIFQTYDEIYPLDEGLHKGTIFPELYIPYETEECKRGCAK